MKIETVLCREGSMDNYAYIIIDEDTGVSAIVDAPEAANIVNRCLELGIKPEYILNTHHHFDHTDANIELKNIFGSKIVGAAYDEHRIPGIDISVRDGDIFKIGSLEAHIIHAEGHTTGHILWYFSKEKALFTGDVLFNLCVGGLFEGTSEQMLNSLKKIKTLPDDVMFYPGHEYTIHAIGFAMRANTGNSVMDEYVKIAQERLDKGLPVSPISLGMEKACNPYLKADSKEDIKNLF
ncbi:MAG: hydroxyacylglutathione hydrolase [Lactobacillaceae bacterium]|jgi:hydroxyacylglutathione hydrolase|nr:hydroxyacylglutathione hydrolase [Lactobacillaceae bacterium]